MDDIKIKRQLSGQFLQESVNEAVKNVKQLGGGPFGAVIVKDGQIFEYGSNKVAINNDPSAHAEVMAIRNACKKLGSPNLQGYELYASCEPCPMCLSAAYWSNITKIFFAANQKDAAKFNFDDQFIYKELEKEINNRIIPSEQISTENKLEPFIIWKSKQNKESYSMECFISKQNEKISNKIDQPIQKQNFQISDQKNNQFIQLAMNEAIMNAKDSKGGPFGAIIIKDGKLLAKGFNQVINTNDPTAHAEIIAIKEACKNINGFDLKGCDIYTSCQPSPLGLSAMYWANLSKLYYSASIQDAGQFNFDDELLYQEFKKEKKDRAIEIEEIELDSKLQPFLAWNDKTDKKTYGDNFEPN